jgi:hypothetical protein
MGENGVTVQSEPPGWTKLFVLSERPGGRLNATISRCAPWADVTAWKWPDPLDGVTGRDFDNVAAAIGSLA